MASAASWCAGGRALLVSVPATCTLTDCLRTGVVVLEVALLLAMVPLLESRHARECPSTPSCALDLAPDDYSDAWLATACLLVAGRLVVEVAADDARGWAAAVSAEHQRVTGMCTLMFARLLLCVGHLPGCPRLLVSCWGCLDIVALVSAVLFVVPPPPAYVPLGPPPPCAGPEQPHGQRGAPRACVSSAAGDAGDALAS